MKKAEVQQRQQRSGGAVMVATAILVMMVASLAVTTLVRNRIYENSVKVWESMVRSSPTKRRPHQNFGQALSTAGHLQEALREFKTVLSLDDDGSVPLRDTYREIGVVYFRLGLLDEAITAWKNGLRYAPGDAGLMNNLAIALMRQSKIDEAISYAEAAARGNEYMAEPMNTLGELYLKKGDPQKAVQYFRRYLYLRPEDPRGYWNAALALKDAGDLRGSLEYATRFLAQEPDPNFRQAAVQLVEFLNSRLKQPR
jgi:tetratricopeptide (TPR) repeat protein